MNSHETKKNLTTGKKNLKKPANKQNKMQEKKKKKEKEKKKTPPQSKKKKLTNKQNKTKMPYIFHFVFYQVSTVWSLGIWACICLHLNLLHVS